MITDSEVLMMTTLGIGNDAQTLASDCLCRLGYGAFRGKSVPSFLQTVIIAPLAPMFGTEESIAKTVEDSFYHVILPNVSNEHAVVLRKSWPKIVTQAFKSQGRMVNLVVLMYKDKITHATDEDGNTVDLPKTRQINRLCWFLFKTNTSFIGGIGET